MGWEKRGNRLVYYRKKRVGRRVVSIYCGSGERGRAAELEDLERRGALSSEKTPESEPQSEPGAGRENLRELFERAVRPLVNASGVLQGATPVAAEGATPQTVEQAPDAASEPNPYWSKFLPRRPPAVRKYRTSRYRS